MNIENPKKWLSYEALIPEVLNQIEHAGKGLGESLFRNLNYFLEVDYPEGFNETVIEFFNAPRFEQEELVDILGITSEEVRILIDQGELSGELVTYGDSDCMEFSYIEIFEYFTRRSDMAADKFFADEKNAIAKNRSTENLHDKH